MKNINLLLIFAAVSLVTASCKQTPVDGDRCEHPIFNHSYEIDFDSQAKDTLLIANHQGWGLSSVGWVDSTVIIPATKEMQIPLKIDYGWIAVERTNGTTLKVSAKENTSDTNRSVIVSLSGNPMCSLRFIVTQKGKTK